MKREREIEIPNEHFLKDEEANAKLAFINEIAVRNELPTKNLDYHLGAIAFANAYHPIVECITAKPWDGVPRLDKFIGTIHAENPELAYTLIKTWMTATIASAYSVDGFVHQGVLVLQGPQKIGKTEWMKRLDPGNCNATKESGFLDVKNKDSIAQLASYWIVELAELESIFARNQQGSLKAFISMSFDQLRLPYARQPVKMFRRTSYVATVNQSEFLVDPTGNRRWWVIAATSIDLDHGLDMQQVWAEVYAGWQSGWRQDITDDIQDQLNINNEQHEEINPIEQSFLKYFNWSLTQSSQAITVTEALHRIGYTQPTNTHIRQAGRALTKLTGKKSRKCNGQMVYDVPFI
jgi:putative DNA primase/helicase